MVVSIESFIAGFAYGGTTVLVGQPMDTIKTLVQVQASSSSSVGSGSGSSSSSSTKYASSNNNHPTLLRTVRDLYSSSGIRGFYRGGTALFVGGGLMRSAQFGVYNSVITTLNNQQGGKTLPSQYWFGCIDPNVVLAGYAGGVGRGLVEGPFEMVKVRRQVVSGWNIQDVFRGFGTTLFRNSFLFSSFVIYMDIFRQEIEEKRAYTVYPGIKAGICANIAWATIWPLDVVKTRRQSGKYDGKSLGWLLRDAFRNGDMYRGLTMGMLRSFIANGVSMEVYTVVERELNGQFAAR
jgi:solute carrier family 25 carnitine/acylcarnitine transporter 20/29